MSRSPVNDLDIMSATDENSPPRDRPLYVSHAVGMSIHSLNTMPAAPSNVLGSGIAFGICARLTAARHAPPRGKKAMLVDANCKKNNLQHSDRKTQVITYEQFKELYDAAGGEPEFPFYFDEECDDEYMLIKYDDGPTFEKCFDERFDVQKFSSLDELYAATMPDGVCLQRDWEKIRSIMFRYFYILDIPSDFEKCWNAIHRSGPEAS